MSAGVDWQPLADDLQAKIKENLIAQDHRASGALLDSISVIVKELTGGWTIEGWALDYSRWVNNGRRAGTMPPISALLDWMQERGIGSDLKKEYQRRGLAFVIGRSISRKGITPAGGYSSHYSRGNGLKRTDYITDVLESESENIANFVQERLGDIADYVIYDRLKDQIKWLQQ